MVALPALQAHLHLLLRLQLALTVLPVATVLSSSQIALLVHRAHIPILSDPLHVTYALLGLPHHSQSLLTSLCARLDAAQAPAGWGVPHVLLANSPIFQALLLVKSAQQALALCQGLHSVLDVVLTAIVKLLHHWHALRVPLAVLRALQGNTTTEVSHIAPDALLELIQPPSKQIIQMFVSLAILDFPPSLPILGSLFVPVVWP